MCVELTRTIHLIALQYREKIFSLPELAMYNGRDPKKPVYVSVCDGTENKTEQGREMGAKHADR